MKALTALRTGASELEGILGPHGFRFVETDSGQSSGGHFASGEFRLGERRLELHVRESLGMVRYHVGRDSLSHVDLTRAVRATGGATEPPAYPGFSEDPLDAFRHLARDLSRFGHVFAAGRSEEFATLVEWVRRHPAPRGLSALE